MHYTCIYMIQNRNSYKYAFIKLKLDLRYALIKL